MMCGLGSHETRVLGFGCAVGAARQSLKPLPIPNLDDPSGGFDELARLQHLHRFRNPSSAHAQHNGDEIMGERAGVSMGWVMSCEDPSCEPLLQIGVAVYQQGLRRLEMECLNIQEQALTKASALAHSL